MQDQKVTQQYAFLSVPVEALEDAGISSGSLLEITVEENKLIIRAVTDMKDFVCDGDCENCPVNSTDCDGDCENCPCKDHCEE